MRALLEAVMLSSIKSALKGFLSLFCDRKRAGMFPRKRVRKHLFDRLEYSGIVKTCLYHYGRG